jgi:hypothetical protein
MTAGCARSTLPPGEEFWRWDGSIFSEEGSMRQISIIVATAIITATVAVAGVFSVNPNSTRLGVVVRTSTPPDVLQMMKDAKDLPEQGYQAF